MEASEMSPALVKPQAFRGEYLILQVALPGVDPENVGVLLLDPDANRLYSRIRRDMEEFGRDEAFWLVHLADEISQRSQELGAQQYLDWMEATLSNTLLISGRESVPVDNYEKTVDRLYAKHIRSRVLPFLTHLPQYSIEAAAGKFGNQMDVRPEGWVEVLSDTPLTEDMFIVHVAGRSMQPIIPDGSLCVFRHILAPYSGKVLLVAHYGEEGGDRYAVSRYHASSAADCDREGDVAWLHERFTLEPANADYRPWDIPSADKARVLGEFLFVI
jgi:hypothetical protein